MFRTLLDNLGTILGLFGFLKIFWFIKNLAKTRPYMEHSAKRFFRKNCPKTCSKHVWTFFGNDFRHFWNFENFLIFWKRFEDSTLRGTLGKKNFSIKVPQNMFKTILDGLGTILYVFGILNFFNFLNSISKTRPSMEHWAKKFFEKITPKLVQKAFGCFRERFCAFLEFWKYFDILKTFRRLDPPWNTGQKKLSGKITPKHVQNTFAHFWERFWAIMEFWEFFDLKTFRRLDPPWSTGQKKISKKLPQNMFKTLLDILGTILGLFGILKMFWFKNISKTRPSMEHSAKKFFRKNYPKTCSKHVWTFFGNDFRHFWNFEKFLIFWEHFEESTLHGTLGKKKFSGKITTKHVQNTFAHFWEQFWAIM